MARLHSVLQNCCKRMNAWPAEQETHR